MIWLTFNKNPPIHSQLIIGPIFFFVCEFLSFWKYVNLLYMYSILGRGSFCFNLSQFAWHGGDQFVALLRWCEAQVSLTVVFSSSALFGLLFLIFLLTIPHRFSMFRSGEFTGQSSTPTPWSFNQLLVLLAVWAGAKSCWKMVTDRGNLTLDFKQLGL